VSATNGRLRGGIDLGGTKIEAIVVDERHQVRGQARLPTPTEGGPADVAAAMTAAMAKAAAAAGVAPTALLGVGAGSPGTVEAASGTVTGARNLPGWSGSYPLAAELRRRLGVPAYVGNDVAVATNAEHKLGAGKEYRSLLGVFWGTGVGGGLILDRRPWHGRGGAGEIGHMVIKRGGARCPCGRRGCVEAYAGRSAMEARARRALAKGRRTELFELMHERGRTRLTSSIWWHAVERGDKLAVKLVERAVKALGAGIASAVNLLDPEAVLIGGGLGVRFGEPYVRRIAEAMRPHLFNDRTPPPVMLASLGDLGGALGAALLVPSDAA